MCSSDLFPSLKQLQTVLIGFAGIGLGKNPNGFIQNDIRPRWMIMWEEKRSIALTAIAMVVVYLLRTTGTIKNYPFAIIELCLLVLGPQLALYLRNRRPEYVAEAKPLPLEWVGVTRPFTPADVGEMDQALEPLPGAVS